MIETDLPIKANPLKDLIELHHNTEAILDTRVPVQRRDQILPKEIGSLRTGKEETRVIGPEIGIKMVDKDQETGIKVLDKDQETEIKVVDMEDHLAGYHTPAHPGTTLDMMEDRTLL